MKQLIVDNGITKYISFSQILIHLNKNKHKTMKSFISALSLIATLAAASEGDPAYGNHGGAALGAYGSFGLGGMPSDYQNGHRYDPKAAPIKIIGATKYTSESVLGGSNFNSRTKEIMPDFYDQTSHYDDYAHGKHGWKALAKG